MRPWWRWHWSYNAGFSHKKSDISLSGHWKTIHWRIPVMPAKMYPRLRDSRAIETPNQNKNYLHVRNLSTFRQIIFCVVAVVAWQVPEGIIECQKLSTGFEGLDGFPVEFIIRKLHSPLHLSFSLPLLGDNNQGIRKSVFLSILDSVARVVLVNVSSLGKRLFCAAFSRTMPETILWVLVPFPLGWERLVTYGLPLAEVGVEAKCIDPT